MGFLLECRNFFRETRRNFHDTGSVLPSSRFLGRALASELTRPRDPGRILEVGPGTGPVTRQILKQMLPGDQLDLVELNSYFVKLLKGRMETEWQSWRSQKQLQLIHAALEDLPGEHLYDYIISGLPLNNFAVAHVRAIYRAYCRLLKPGGSLSYFEYLWVRHLKSPFVGRSERRRLAGVGHVTTHYIRAFQVRRQTIFINVPPAVVRHLCFKQATPAATKMLH